MKKLKFILVDDNEAFRCALRMLLINQYNAEIIAEASNADDVLLIPDLHKADIILMDLMIPGKNGIDITKELLWKYSRHFKIVAITMHAEKVYLTTLIEAGFRGCIFKNDLYNQLTEALSVVYDGNLYFPKDILLDYNKQY